MIAVLLEICLSKRRILELYLNMAQWGHQIYGAEAAARHHFQVSAAQLSPFQAAQLAAMLPRPNYTISKAQPTISISAPTGFWSKCSWCVSRTRRSMCGLPIPHPHQRPRKRATPTSNLGAGALGLHRQTRTTRLDTTRCRAAGDTRRRS